MFQSIMECEREGYAHLHRQRPPAPLHLLRCVHNAERALAHQNLGQKEEAQKDFEQGLKLNNDLRLMIDIHLLDLQLQIKEMRRRQAAIHRNIA